MHSSFPFGLGGDVGFAVGTASRGTRLVRWFGLCVSTWNRVRLWFADRLGLGCGCGLVSEQERGVGQAQGPGLVEG